MKKTKLLSILAVSPLIIGGLAIMNGKQAKSSSAAGIDELAPWGECEEDYTDTLTNFSFSADSEHLVGAKSWKLSSSDQQIRLNVQPNGSIYEGSAYFKGTAGQTVTLIGVLPYQLDGGWQTGYFDGWAPMTLTGGWDEYKFAFSCKQDGDYILMDKNGDGQFEEPAKLTGTFGAVNMLFRFSQGPVYMDHFNYHIKGEVPQGSLQGAGDAENSYFGESWSCFARTYEDSYKGGHSYKLPAFTNARLMSPMTDGTVYNGSLKVKGTQGEQFKLTFTMTCSDGAGGYKYGYLDLCPTIDLTGGWDDYNFSFALEMDLSKSLLKIDRTGNGYDNQLEGVDAVAGFDVQSNVNVYADEFYIVAQQGQQEEIDYTDAVVHYDFDNGIAPFEQLGGTTGSTLHTTEAGEVYRGTGAMKVKSVWSCYIDSACEWIQQGDFLEFSAFIKNLAASPSSAAYVQLQTWSCDAVDGTAGWAITDTRIDLIHYNNGATNDTFKLLKGVFGVYSDGSESFIYHNGKLVDAGIPKGNVVAPQIRFDIGASGEDFLSYDDVAIMKTTVTKDAVVTVSGLAQPGLEVYKNGQLDGAQVSVEGNKLIAKDLSYGNFKDTYTLKIYDGTQVVGERVVSFQHSEASFSPAYNASVKVKDVDGNPVTDATVSYEGGEVTENNNGVYTINNVSGDLAITVSKEGYIDARATVTVDNPNVEVTLKQPKPVNEYEDNLFPKNAGMEDGWTYSPNKQGVDYAVVDNEQYEGSHSLRISANTEFARSLFRVQDGPNYSGNTYRIEAMVKAEKGTSVQFSLGAMFTCQSQSGWAYGQAIPDAVEVGDEWTLVSMTFGYVFDPLAGTLSVSTNGGEPAVIDGIVSVAAYDFVLVLNGANDVAYVDDLAMYETYNARVNVIGADGQPSKNASFVVADPRGNSGTVNLAYSEEAGCYLFQGLYGAQTITATAGGVTFDPVKVTKAIAASDINIEKSYTITLTIKDQYDAPVTGAKVVARKGITNVGEFEEVGNGVYKLEGVMGEVTVVITLDNYEFEKVTVSAANATLTVTGTNNNPVGPGDSSETTSSGSQDEPAKGGCGGSILAASSLVALISLAGVIFVANKRKEN